MSPASERDIAEQRVLDARAAEAALRAEFLTPARAECAESEERGDSDAGERYGYELVSPNSDGKLHFRIHDGRDNAICFCYVEYHAQQVVAALNAALRHPPREGGEAQAALEAGWFRWLRDNPQSAAWLLAQTAKNAPHGPRLDASMASGHVIGVVEDVYAPDYRFSWLHVPAAPSAPARVSEAMRLGIRDAIYEALRYFGRHDVYTSAEYLKAATKAADALAARPGEAEVEAPLPITAVQVRAALALAESQPASTDATDLSIALEHLLRWIESGRQYPRPAREAPCVHQFTASAAGAPPSEYMPRLEDSVCAKCGVPFQSATRTDDRRENDRHPVRPL